MQTCVRKGPHTHFHKGREKEQDNKEQWGEIGDVKQTIMYIIYNAVLHVRTYNASYETTAPLRQFAELLRGSSQNYTDVFIT